MNIALSGEWSSIVATALVSLLGFLVASLVRSKLREAELQTRFLSSAKSEDEWRKRAIEASELVDEATALAREEREKAEEWKKKAVDQAAVFLKKNRKIEDLQALADEAAVHKANHEGLVAHLALIERESGHWKQKAQQEEENELSLKHGEIFALTRKKEDLESLNRHLREEMEVQKAQKRSREIDLALARTEHAEDVERLKVIIKHLCAKAAGEDQDQETPLLQKMRQTWGE